MRDLPPPPGASLAPVALCAEDVVLRREGALLLDHVSLVLSGASPTMIVGPNGAGKSVLLRVLHGLEPPQSGRITQGGLALGAAARARQAMVFQHPVLLRRSVAANLDFVLRPRLPRRAARREEAAHLLRKGGLLSKARQPARSLSGGEAQRLAILRALATRPEVLFLDEPSSNLDPAATQAVEALIADAALQGVRVVMVTHDMGQARRLGCEIVFLHKGKVVETAPAAGFFAAPVSSLAVQFLAGMLLP